MSEPLTREEVEALPAGTIIEVIWSGGNGPHRYRVHVEPDGQRYAASLDGNPRMLTYNQGRQPRLGCDNAPVQRSRAGHGRAGMTLYIGRHAALYSTPVGKENE